MRNNPHLIVQLNEGQMSNFTLKIKVGTALLLAFHGLSAFCSISDPCRSEQVESKRLFCQAINHLDANKCSQITNLDMRQHCILQVKDGQRGVTWGLAKKKPAD